MKKYFITSLRQKHTKWLTHIQEENHGRTHHYQNYHSRRTKSSQFKSCSNRLLHHHHHHRLLHQVKTYKITKQMKYKMQM